MNELQLCVTCNTLKSEFDPEHYQRRPKQRCKDCWRDYRIARYKTTPGVAEKERSRQKDLRAYYKALVYDAYGRICNCCSEDNTFFLSIDHVNGGGNEHRREIKASGGYVFHKWLVDNNFPEGFQTYCYNCNLGKARNKGVCPHEGTVAQVN